MFGLALDGNKTCLAKMYLICQLAATINALKTQL